MSTGESIGPVLTVLAFAPAYGLAVRAERSPRLRRLFARLAAAPDLSFWHDDDDPARSMRDLSRISRG